MNKKQYTDYIKSLGINPSEPMPDSTERVGVRPGYLPEAPETPTSTERVGVRPGYLPENPETPETPAPTMRVGVRPGYLPPDTPVSDSEYIDNLAGTLEKPLTQEEQDRRVRATYSASAMGALGNALSAFSNLAFTGGVAPSQELPNTYLPNKDVESFRNRVNKVRDAYLNNLTTREKLRQQDALTKWKIQNAADTMGYKRDRLAFDKEREQRYRDQQDLEERKLEWRKQKEQGTLDLKKEELRIKEAYNKGMISLKARDTAIRELNAMGKTVEENRSFDADGNIVSKTTVTTPNGQNGKQNKGTMTGVREDNKTMPGVKG